MNQPQERLSPSEFFMTFDLGLTCALFCLEHELHALAKGRETNKSQFIFRRDKTLDRDIEAYWNGQLKIDARTYFDAIRCVKNRLYSS